MKRIKVLMATMGLGLGGAETHIVELSKQLHKMGVDVAVCSNGGEYVEELTREGVRHVSVPLHVRSVFLMVKSFFAILRLLRKERPDVVHAHARIPALICSIACRLRGIPMVTTAHFNFRVSRLLRFLTRWGERTIAVSEDLKRYLIENYNIPEEHISLTVNSINTDAFSPETDASALREELGLSPDARVIVWVSRMDQNACEGALRLIKSTPAIHARYPEVRVVVVGAGNALEQAKALAEEVNGKLSEKVVTITGGRTDINRFCALSDIFVGVSRAALEAMSCEKPVVLAGNQGYLGLFTRDKLPACVATNFTCRGYPYPSEDTLQKDLLGLLDTYDSLGEVRKDARRVILERYSIERMAEDTYSVYREVLRGKERYDFLICGYYGYQNAGDEVILKSILQNLTSLEPELSICVLSRSTADLSGMQGITTINRFSLLPILRAVRRSRVMLFGGGSLIQDVSSTKSLMYYLFLLWMARRCGLRSMLYANGIGPVEKPRNIRLVSRVLNRVDVISLREERSAELLRKLGVTRPHIETTADEAFTVAPPDPIRAKKLVDALGLSGHRFIAVSLRRWRFSDPAFVPKMVSLLDEAARRHDCRILFVPMQYDKDSAICFEIAKSMREKVQVAGALSPDELTDVFSQSELVIGMRLHALILGVGAGTPCLGIVYDPKVEGFLEYIGVQHYTYCHRLDVGRLRGMIDELFTNPKERRTELFKTVAKQRTLAQRNAQLALGLLEGTLHGRQT